MSEIRSWRSIRLAVFSILLAGCHQTGNPLFIDVPSEAGTAPANLATKPAGTARAYEVLERTLGRDPVVKRLDLRVLVDTNISREDFDATLRKAVADAVQDVRDLDVIRVFASDRRQDTNEATYGRAAATAVSHDRSSYKYNFYINSKVGALSGRPSPEQYAIYDGVNAEMDKIIANDPKTVTFADDAISVFASKQNLPVRRVKEIYDSVYIYQAK